MIDRVLRARTVLAIVMAILAISNIALSFALIRESAAKKSIVLVPEAGAARELTANEPPEIMVRDFVLIYLAQFDNYTAATVEESTRTVSGWLSPRFFAQAMNALDRRRELVAQSRMASQFLPPKASDVRVTRLPSDEIEVAVRAVRRVYLADKLQSEQLMLYVVVVEAGAPTPANPHGLYVTGQLVEPSKKDTDNRAQ